MSNKTKAGHTPGPWTVGYEYKGKIVIHGKVSDKLVAVSEKLGMNCLGMMVAEIEGDTKDAVNNANARLIAAAPELLTEVKRELDWLLHVRAQIQAPANVMLGFDQAVKYLSAAIAKAEGGAK